MAPFPRPHLRARLWSAALLLASMGAACRRTPPPPVLFTLPDFQLVDEQGRPFAAGQLDGRVWVADFFFTSCPTYCPLLTERMKSLRASLRGERDRVGFLSLSVDPQTDTPERLRRYAGKHALKLGDRSLPPWHLLTGATDEVAQVVVRGFRLPMGAPQPLEGRGDDRSKVYQILHARHFVLVDGRHRVRGFYRTEKEGLDKLRADLAAVLREGGG